MATNRSNFESRQLGTLFNLGRLDGRTDHQLLEWFETHQGKAEAAFEELVARHGAMVLDVCRRILQDPHDVDDAFQATFLILARRAGTIRNRDALGGWLHRVALRVALRLKSDAARRRDVERRVVAAEAHEATPWDVERSEVQAAVHEELDRLPTSYRAALIACHLEGLTHEEAASRLGWPVGTVRSRLARGRDRLRDRLVRRGLAPGVAAAALTAQAEAAPAALQALTVQAMGSEIVAGTVSARALILARQVVQAMNLRTLGLCTSLVMTVAAAAGLAPLGMMRATRPVVADVEVREEPPAIAGRLSGIVGDTEHHRPVAGATVVAGASSGGPNHQITTTGEDGRFSISWKADGKQPDYVVAYKEGLAPASTSRIRIVEREPILSCRTELLLDRPVAFTRKVQDSDGRPIAGARVRLLYLKSPRAFDLHAIEANVVRGTPLEVLFQAVSDAQGHVRFPAVPAPPAVMVEVRHDGYGDLVKEIPRLNASGIFAASGDSPVPLRMYPEARVAGRVTTRIPGVSVAGLKIGLQSTVSMAFWREARTDAEGRFEFRGLPRGDFDVYPFGHPSDGPWTYRAVADLALKPGETARATIELIEGCLVEGQVIDVDTKRPIPGASVDVFGPVRPRRSAGRLSAKTDDEGRYRVRLPTGQNRLSAKDARFLVGAAVVDFEIADDVKARTAPLLKVGDVPAEFPTPYDGIDP